MELKKREFILGYVIVGLVAIGAVSKFLFGPFASKLAVIDRSVVVQEAKLKKGITLIERKEEINKEYEKYASFFSLTGTSEEEAVVAVLKEVEKISRDSGLTIVDMKPQKETKADKFSRQYNLSIKAEGDMEQLVDFLYSLSSSSLLLSVEKMVLSPKTEGSSDLNITLTVGGIVFL